jgi:hypothetical protein
MGATAEFAQELFKLTSALAWYAMGEAIHSFGAQPALNRRARCLEVCRKINEQLLVSTEFGKAFAEAKRDYQLAVRVYNEASLIQRVAPDLPRAPKGILAKKTNLTRRARVVEGEVPNDGTTPYEVLIQKQTVKGPNGDNTRYSLTWEEEDGATWELSPILLPELVVSKKANEKRFLHL